MAEKPQLLLARGHNEAGKWQLVGDVIGIAGAGLLVYAFFRYRIGTVTPEGLLLGAVASFMMLVGVALFCTGRALAVEDTPMYRREERLWNLLTATCAICGAFCFLLVWRWSAVNGDFITRFAVVLTGAFSWLAGVYFFIARRLAKAQQEVYRQKLEVTKQQELAESLLLNTLPATVASELKAKGAVDPRYHEDCTILFTDFKGFTLSTEKLAADELVKALHEYFTAFDAVVGKYGLEKLKTIGDSYMCVAGLPERKPSHAVDAVLAAFELVEAVKRCHAAGLPSWEVRIGVHTGPVISGVVGIRKFAFDIWGESVNFASRMESSGHPNRINLSESTFKRVKDFFECEHRGKVATKEKREFDMYFAIGPLLTLRADTFAARYQSYFQHKLPGCPFGESKSEVGKG